MDPDLTPEMNAKLAELCEDVGKQATALVLLAADQQDLRLTDNDVLSVESGVYAGASVMFQMLHERGMLSAEGMAAFLFAEGER